MEENQSGCMLCPRMCHAKRAEGKQGYCGADGHIRVARSALHMWEEPCISGTKGSGTVFFSGCHLKCCFCQNHEISRDCKGIDITEETLARMFLTLQSRGAHNINLVSATPYTDAVLRVLDRIRGKELKIPIIWNTGGYEHIETLKRLWGYIDIYLPDCKYYDAARAKRYSKAEDYFSVTMDAIQEMVRQCGEYHISGEEIMTRGVIVRHLVMPGGRHDSLAVIDALKNAFSQKEILISLMSQYTPCFQAENYPEINRRVTKFEYESVAKAVEESGFDGFFQEKASATSAFIPTFFGQTKN